MIECDFRVGNIGEVVDGESRGDACWIGSRSSIHPYEAVDLAPPLYFSGIIPRLLKRDNSIPPTAYYMCRLSRFKHSIGTVSLHSLCR